MANPNHVGVVTITLPANTDLSTKQYYVADCNSSGNAFVAAAGSTFVGVIGNTPSVAGQATEIMISGVCPVVCGGTVAVGDAVKIDSSGRAVAASSGDKAIGRALSAATSGNQANILLQPHTMA